MEKNATINSRLKDLLDVMDARATVNIFIEREDGKHKSLVFCRVYEVFSSPDFNRKYKNCEVVGLCCGLTTNILIKEEV